MKSDLKKAVIADMLEVSQAAAANAVHVVDLPYRFSSWAMDEPENVALWHDEKERLIAWAVMQTPFWTVDYAVHPALAGADLHASVLNWVDETARRLLETKKGHPAWFVPVFSDHEQQIRALESAGFTCQTHVPSPWSQVLLMRNLAQPLEQLSLPKGFHLRALDGAREVAAYVELHQAVFGTRNMTEVWRANTRSQEQYRPELDLVVTDPQGKLAAFCIGWLGTIATQDRASHLNESGQIEPLGVGEAYRGLGLGRMLLREQFRRMVEMGARQVLVETDHEPGPALRLYESEGFRIIRRIDMFRKDYADWPPD